MKNKNISVSIIGAGASGLAFVHSLIQNNSFEKDIIISITVYDRLDKMGRGNAYLDDINSNLMNTKAGYLTFSNTRPGDFYIWILNNEDYLVEKYSLKEINEHCYYPRSMFGEYLSQKWYEIVNMLPINVKLNFVDTLVDDIEYNQNRYLIFRNDGYVDFSNYIVLAVGTSNRMMESKYYDLGIKIIDNPYPTKNLLKTLKNIQNVVVIGSRLSAIDSIISLKENGFDGDITMHCINGTFPSVRGTQGRYTNKFLCENYIEENYKDRLSFEDIVTLFNKELSHFNSINEENLEEDILKVFNSIPINDLENFIDYEIRMANGKRGWQAVFYDTNRSVSYVWKRLDSVQKKKFLSEYSNKIMGMRVSIPQENAYKIISYLRQGGLKFSTGKFDFISNSNDEITFKAESDHVHNNIEAIIFATGSPAYVKHSQNQLIKTLKRSGLLSQHEFGGIRIDDHSKAIDINGNVNDSLYVLGDLTKGEHLFLAALDIIRKQSHEVALNFTKNLKLRHDVSMDSRI